MEKTEARRRVAEAVGRLSAVERRAKSEAITTRLAALDELRAAQTVMATLPMPDEWDTRPLLDALLRAGKRIYLPRTDLAQRSMTPARLIGLDRIRRGAYGIDEPDSDETCSVADLDFILAPARAFDRQGNRLGRGGGYYDRFFAQPGQRATLCGAAFACQVLAHVPHDAHDLPVQIIVTETETLRLAQ